MRQPDMQGVFSPASYKQGFVGLLDDYPGMTCGVWQHRPESTGYVRARISRSVCRSDHSAELSEGFDGSAGSGQGHATGRGSCCTRSAWRRISMSMRCPGPDVQTDEEWLDYARQYGSTAYHLIGTARMGPATDKTSVVDDQLRVHGLQGIRVVDASIMPNMPSANTYSSTMMIAEKASDMIRGRAPLPPVEGIAA